jgi:hypothetical protein
MLSSELVSDFVMVYNRVGFLLFDFDIAKIRQQRTYSVNVQLLSVVNNCKRL